MKINVLCARVRVEEKRLIEALALAGATASALPPCSEPMPLGPSPLQPFADFSANGISALVNQIVIDRCQDRVVAAAILPLLAASGAELVDAGVAATGDRLAIVTALNRAGIARPATLLTTSEETGMAAFDRLGVPSTLLPLNPGSPAIVLRDREVAEAVFEHRNVLGRSNDAVALLQKGVAETGKMLALVAARKAIAIDGDEFGPAQLRSALALAEAAAAALRAELVAIEIAVIDGALVVWDVVPVPEYRGMRPLTPGSIEDALRDFLLNERRDGSANATERGRQVNALIRREARDGVVLSA